LPPLDDPAGLVGADPRHEQRGRVRLDVEQSGKPRIDAGNREAGRNTGVTAAEATRALDAAAGDTAVALVMVVRDVDPAASRDRLHAAAGHVRNALS
jgi:N-acetylmuramic acid 6-phosphate (MurNAc-6-P) etherase